MTTLEQKFATLDYPEEPGREIQVLIEATEGYFASPPRPYVLVLHGFKGFMHWGFFPDLSQRLAHAGYVVVRFNASGSGIGPDLENFTEERAFANNTYSRELEDADRVRAWVRSGGVPGADPSRSAILGHSRGGGMALIHAAEHGDYSSVVTWAAIDEVDRFDEATKEEWRASGHILVHNGRTNQDHLIGLGALIDVEQNRRRLDIQAACGRLLSPTLVVHGDHDEAVEAESAQRLFAALPDGSSRLLIIEGAGHTFGATHPYAGAPEPLERVFDATLDHLARGFR